jgi:hypothetical protein
MKNSLLVLMLLALSVQVASADGGQDSYTKLKAFYESASKPAQFSDLLSIETKNCVAVSSGASFGITALSPFALNYFQSIVIPGTPSQGPLFPGTPDRTVNNCVIWTASSTEGDAFCGNESVTTTSTDLVFSAMEADTQGIYDVPATLFVRMNGANVSFFEQETSTTASSPTGQPGQETVTSYGYCY